MAEDGEMLKLLLLGKSGHGKSTTGNTIAGQNLFHVGISFGGVTRECSRKVVPKDGYMLEILDWPGLFDPNVSVKEISLQIIQAVGGMYDRIYLGPHAILFVVRIGRYTSEVHESYKQLKGLFDDNITNYMIVLFTGGDDVEEAGTTIDDMIHSESTPETLWQVIRECSNRYVVFNNKAVDKQPQVEELLSMIRQMVAQNNGQTYFCPKWNSVREAMEEKVNEFLNTTRKEELRQLMEQEDSEYKDKLTLITNEEMEKLKDKVVKEPAMLCTALNVICGTVADFFRLLGCFVTGKRLILSLAGHPFNEQEEPE